MPRPLPTFAQIHAVQKVLYNDIVWRDIEGALESVDGTMDTDFARHVKLVCTHQLCVPLISPTEGAKYADEVARLLLTLRGKLDHVQHINGADKADLITGVDELAKSWQARANAWRAIAGGATNVAALLTAISVPFRASADAFARVQEYLR